MTHTIGMISLGCAKNQVNAEHMLWLLRQAGYEISPDPDGAELVIVNTCGFIESAKLSGGDSAGNAGGRRRAWHRLLL